MTSPSDRRSDNNLPDVPDERSFVCMYSKALAEALRAKEAEEADERRRRTLRPMTGNAGFGGVDVNEREKQRERERSTYSELCYDDPIVTGGDGDCRLLAQALVPKLRGGDLGANVSTKEKASEILSTNEETHSLALSPRFVDGLLQATSRVGATRKSAAHSPSAATSSEMNSKQSKKDERINNDESEKPSNERMFGSTTATTSQGYAELAFAVFVEGPYRCIQHPENLKLAASFLGSFEPPEEVARVQQSELDRSRLVKEATESFVNGLEKMSLEGKHGKEANSYSPKSSISNPRPDSQDDASSSSSDCFRPSGANFVQYDSSNDNDSMEEIFADESDPDDFEYESSFRPQACGFPDSDVQTNLRSERNNPDYAHFDVSNYGFNPLLLSQPSTLNQTWSGARRAIRFLLSNQAYGKLALSSISSRAWLELGVSDTLADLSFILLLHNTQKFRGKNETITKDSLLCEENDPKDGTYDCGKIEDITALWDRPLFLLRDRALDVNHGYDALSSYLQLLGAFLAHSEKEVLSTSPFSCLHPSTCLLPPAAAVGLSCLANICSSNELTCTLSARMYGVSTLSVCPRDEVKKSILSSLHHLAFILERVRPRKATLDMSGNITNGKILSSAELPWIRVVMCIIPMMEFLADIRARYDFEPVFEGGSSRNAFFSEPDSNAFVDSGLFREMLAIYCKTAKSSTETPSKTTNTFGSFAPDHSAGNDNATKVARLQLLRTIFALSIQAPEILGRYAVRMPDLALEVKSDKFTEENLVDGILWSFLGSSLLESKSETSQPRLKLRTRLKPNHEEMKRSITFTDCSIVSFEAMCRSSIFALQFLSQYMQDAENQLLATDKNTNFEDCKKNVGNILIFSNCLSNCLHAKKMWLTSLINKQGAVQRAKAAIGEVRSILNTLPSFSDSFEAHNTDHKKDDENDEDFGSDFDGLGSEDRRKIRNLRQKVKDCSAITASVRSSVKTVMLALGSLDEESMLSQKGPMRNDVSSKTD